MSSERPPPLVVRLRVEGFSLSDANRIMDTQLGILPSSPDICIVSTELVPQCDRAYKTKFLPEGTQDALNSLIRDIGSTHVQFWVIRDSTVNSCELDFPFVVTIIIHRFWPSPPPLPSYATTSDVHIGVAGPLETPNALRAAILPHIQKYTTGRFAGLPGDLLFRPFVFRQSLRMVVALGGLSECGKSTFGDAVDTGFGARGRREKIAYLLDSATRQLGVDAYSLTEEVQAHLMVQQLEYISKAHFWIGVISLESVHRYGSIKELKRILGPLLQIVYIDVDQTHRLEREIARVGEEYRASKTVEIARKDELKEKRGAGKVKEIADLVVDNSGELHESIQAFRAHINGTLEDGRVPTVQ